MKTVVSSAGNEVQISETMPTVLIGEKINPSGKKRLAEALQSHDLDYVRQLAMAQAEAGADILDVNVAGPGLDEVALLPEVVTAIMDAVDIPLCLDFNDPAALQGALNVYKGKPLINSVTGEEDSLREILPLVKEYNTAVIGLTIDDAGIPKDAGMRVDIAGKILERAESFDIPREDVIIDCLALTLGSDTNTALMTLDAVRGIKETFGCNQTLGASNVSFGLPDRGVINRTFLAIAIAAGVTCPTVDAEKVRATIFTTDLILGRDRFSQRYIKDYRRRQKEAER